MKPVLWILAVGLSPRQIGERTPNLVRLGQRGVSAPMTTVLPAVTLSAQATLLTGLLPRDHGVVGNGWYWPELGEVMFWRQPNALVQGPKVYERARAQWPGFTSAKLFAWFNMGAAVDYALTPRPFYPADGRKIPAVQSWPRNLGAELEAELGTFPFFDFWGPKAGLPSSRWLTDATRLVLERKAPTLTMVYLPHLDYDHQRFGPDAPRSLAALKELDDLIGDLVHAADRAGAAVLVTSEYAIEAVDRPVHPNLALRTAGLLSVRETPVGEVLDPTGSAAFAVSDHQIAHVYCKDADARHRAKEILEGLPGVGDVLAGESLREAGLDHPRSGELVLIAERGSWFTYYYWNDPDAAPDFAPTVDIHRKPGYDPAELFLDPGLVSPKLRIAKRLAMKKLGFRYLMDVVPTHGALVRGSHGRLPERPEEGPAFVCSVGFEHCGGTPAAGVVPMTSVADRVLALIGRS